MFVSVTRLRLRSIRFLPAFFWHAEASTRQVRRSPGFAGGYLANQGGLTFWTVTLWADEAAMRAYRSTAAHRAAMPKLLRWCDEASVAHWRQEGGEEAPPPDTVRQRLGQEGRLSKVAHPSAAHAAGTVQPSPAPLRLARVIAPAC
jgi:quinol monooxygenase YgiN